MQHGEIAALVYLAGKPTDLFRRIESNSNLHFVPMPVTAELLQIYLPSSLTHNDYPALVADGLAELPVGTAGVGARVEVGRALEVVLGLRRVGDLAADAREPEDPQRAALVRMAQQVELAALLESAEGTQEPRHDPEKRRQAPDTVGGEEAAALGDENGAAVDSA